MKGSQLTLVALALGGAVHSSVFATTLQDFVSRYAQIESVSITASVSYFLDPADPACGGPAGIPILGSFSYAASGEMWKSRSHLDHEVMSDLRTEIAYDGAMFQYHILEDDVLGVSFGGDDRAAGMTLPNPLFAAAQFLIPVDDSNANEVERLSEIQVAALAANLGTTTWSSDAISLQALEYTDLPGGNHEGHDYIHRVFVITGHRDKPVRIDRISTTGATLTRTMLSAYSDLGDGIELPTAYTMILYNADTGAESGRIEMTITAGEINSAATESLDTVDFQIPWSLAGRVWLIDNEVFVN